MTTESIKELIRLCESGQCGITLDASITGVVANVTALKQGVTRQMSFYLDRNDESIGATLCEAVKRVRE